MRELKLRYVVQLLSNLEGQSGKDAKAMVDAQKRVQDALEKTEGKVGRLERVLLRVAGAGTASAERQAMHLAKLAMSYDRVAKAAERFAAASLKAAKNAPQVAAGVAAGGYVLNAATQKPIAYEKRLADMANTAFNDKDLAGRREGMRTLDSAVRSAIKMGGGSRDDAAAALNAMISSGAVGGREKAILMLPKIMKSSTASGSSAVDVAGLANMLVSGMGIKPEDLGEALNMSLVAGQEGGFEMKDMAKWAGKVSAIGGNAGMKGLEGYRRLLGSMQASVLTASGTDDAGNNLVNLLQKINEEQTAKDFQKQGIDLRGELAKGVASGQTGLDAFLKLTRSVVEKDPRYQEASAKLLKEGDTGAETDQTKLVRDIFQGAGIGKVVQDRQAMLQLIAEMNNQALIERVMGSTRKRKGETDTAFDLIAETSESKKQQAANARDFAMDDAYKAGKPLFDGFYDAVTKVQTEFPTFAAAMAGLTTAANTAAVALGAAGLAGLLNGGKVLPPVPGVPGATGAPGAPGGGATSKLGSMARGAAGYLLPAAAAVWLGQMTGLTPEVDQKRGEELWNKGKKWEASRYLPADELLSRWWRGDKGSMLPPGPGVLGMPEGGIPSFGGQTSLGQGKLDVSVRVTDDRVTATTQVSQPMAGVKINPGNTNPGSYQ